jgi:PST family polysaccharide transporter
VISRGIGLAGTLLLARYLPPYDYGVGMAAAIAVMSASTVTTFGVGIYFVAEPGISRAAAFHASCWFLATGVAALTIMMTLGDSLGQWSGAPELAALLPVLVGATLLERIVYVPEKILVRDLRFDWLSVIRTAGELTYTIVTVSVAALGGGAMAIAWGSLARSAVRALGIVPAVDIRDWLEPHRLQLATFRRIAGYGLNLTATSIAAFGMRRWDNLLVSGYFGAGAMGAYNYAYNLADTPAAAVGDQVNDVIAASFPRLDPRRRAKALVRACTMVSMIMFPLSIGLAAVAPTVVETLLDPRWADVGAMLICLSALSAARPLTAILASYFYASGRPSAVLWLEWGSLIAVVAAMSTVGRAGVNWACVCVSIVFVLRALAGMWLVSRQDGLQISEFLLPLMRPLVACFAMAAGVRVAQLALDGVTAPVRLLLEITLGAAIYAASVSLIARSNCRDLLSVIRSAVSRGSPDPTESTTDIAAGPRVLSLSSEFPNPSEPGKGVFVRARLEAIRSRAALTVVAPVAALDYANPQRDLFAAARIPRTRQEGRIHVLHPRWVYPPYGGWANAFFLFARLLPMVARLRARRAFDVLDAHFAHPEGIAAVLLGRLVGCPVIVTIRGSELRYRTQKAKRFWMSWALRRADRVIAVSDGLRTLAIELGVEPRRVATVPNGINAELFFRRDRNRCRASHGIDAAERIVLSAGDLAELKGHHRIIAAVRTLRDRGVRARLLIAGGVGRSGRYAETLRQQAIASGLGDCVTFVGEVTQDTLAELMSAADVFCLASSTEGWPNVVNEALACGTPVVATDVGAVRQMIVSDLYGYVVPVPDAAALAEALRLALTRDWDHDAISARGRSRSWDRVAEDVLDEMRAVIAERVNTGCAESADVMKGRGAPAALGARFVGMGRQ